MAKAAAAAVVVSADAGPLDPSRVLLAVRAVLAHAAKKQAASGALLPEDETVLVVLALNRIPDAVSLYPLPVPLTHPLQAEPRLCLFVAGDGSAGKAALERAGVAGVKVMGLDKLRKKYKPFEMRRKLAGSYDSFLCDAALQDQLRSVLGKSFIHKKKFPLAVDLAGDLARQVREVRGGTLLHQSAGTTWAIKVWTGAVICLEHLSHVPKVGSAGWEARALAENAVTAVAGAVARHVAGGWRNVRAVHVKSESSLALPVYDAVPPAGLTVPGASAPRVPRRRAAPAEAEEEAENRELLELAREADLDVDEGFRFDLEEEDDEENDIGVREEPLPVRPPARRSGKREQAEERAQERQPEAKKHKSKRKKQ